MSPRYLLTISWVLLCVLLLGILAAPAQAGGYVVNPIPGRKYIITDNGVNPQDYGEEAADPTGNKNAWSGGVEAATTKEYSINTYVYDYKQVSGSCSYSSSDYDTHNRAWLEVDLSQLSGGKFIKEIHLRRFQYQVPAGPYDFTGTFTIIGIMENGSTNVIAQWSINVQDGSTYQWITLDNGNVTTNGWYVKLKFVLEGDFNRGEIIKKFTLEFYDDFITADNAVIENQASGNYVISYSGGEEVLGPGESITFTSDPGTVNIQEAAKAEVYVKDFEGNTVNVSQLTYYWLDGSVTTNKTVVYAADLGLDNDNFSKMLIGAEIFVRYENFSQVLAGETYLYVVDDTDTADVFISVAANKTRAVYVYDKYGNQLWAWLINSSTYVKVRKNVDCYVVIYDFPSYNYLSTIYYNSETGETKEEEVPPIPIGINNTVSVPVNQVNISVSNRTFSPPYLAPWFFGLGAAFLPLLAAGRHYPGVSLMLSGGILASSLTWADWGQYAAMAYAAATTLVGVGIIAAREEVGKK